MAESVPNLKSKQWDFLALLEVFQIPVPIEAVGVLAPLTPGPLINLLEMAIPAGWIQKPTKGLFAIGPDLPVAVKEKLHRRNSHKRLARIVERIHSEKMESLIGPIGMLNLLDRAGRHREAAEYEIDIARRAVGANDLERARPYLESAVRRLYDNYQDRDSGTLLISSTLELSNLCFSLGTGFQNIDRFLLRAQVLAARYGDQRSHAMANLHLGRLYYFTDRRDDAMVALALGHKEIQDLDDEDILGQSAEFIGIFYFIKGLFKEAIKHFEKAEQILESAKTTLLTTPSAPFFLGYCAIYLGQFHRAIGRLDYYWRLAVDQDNTSMATTIRSVLGTVLALMRKSSEASRHLKAALVEAQSSRNALACYFAGGGLALLNFLDGHIEAAYEVLRQTVEIGSRAGLVRQFASPWILEIVHKLHSLGFKPIPDFEYPVLAKRLLEGGNVFLHGVALRLRAADHAAQGKGREIIMRDLAESERLLVLSGGRIQQAKTLFDMARIELQERNRDAARQLVRRARNLLGGYVEEFFPNEFNQLVCEQDRRTDSQLRSQGFLQSYLAMLESLYPSEDRHEILARVLTATSGMFGAERSGLFWFQEGRFSTKPELRAACNLSCKEVQHDTFRESMELILETHRTRQPRMGRLPTAEDAGNSGIRSVLSIPIEVRDRVHGVLYYDNSYLDDAFDFLDLALMKEMARHTNLVVERRFDYLRLKKERNLLASEKSIHMEKERTGIMARSPVMARVLAQVEQVARTESTVIVTGETGTGKGLLARSIHTKSLRAKGPFIVVDSTTIPENLLESELFGHEKGAFTGADKRKIGRIELAHQGTLFMDEIGELSLLAQAKLLRALQDKEFNRVGGTRLISSDFRLVAATNRDLVREVKQGRFREDLYFRLNVIPIHLPPLRERREDIALLAGHFLDRYARKYQRQGLTLTPAQEKMLRQYRWPGNIRELRNIIERAVLLSDDHQLEIQLPADIQMRPENPFADLPTLNEVQRRYIRHVLDRTGGRIGGDGGAAQVLGVKRTSLYSRMRILGMKKEE